MRKDKILCFIKGEEVIPLINHLHCDKENGQKTPHYHVDTRYLSKDPSSYRISQSDDSGYFEYRRLFKITNLGMSAITPISYIKNSKLNCKALEKGRCPHKGFDLKQIEKDKNGITTCPLHGLKVDMVNKKIINGTKKSNNYIHRT